MGTWFKLFATLLLLALVSTPYVRADIEVHKRQDVIVLDDDTELSCIILMISSTGVLIAEADSKDPKLITQRVIAKGRVKQILRGEPHGIEGLQTETEFARKVIRGSGFRDQIVHKEKEKGGREKEKPDSAVAAKKELSAPEPKSVDAAKHPGATADPQAALPEGTLSAKELTEAYLSRFPELRSTALDLFGSERIQEVFDSARNGNETARRDLETFLQPFIGVAEAGSGGATNANGAGAIAPSRLDRLSRIQQSRPQMDTPAVPEKTQP